MYAKYNPDMENPGEKKPKWITKTPGKFTEPSE